ncbi:salicylate hydroxylase [Naviculisporaceae sp. PSN 640]
MNSLPTIITTGTVTASDGGSASVVGDPLNTPVSSSPSPITPSSPAQRDWASSTPFRIAIVGGGIGGLTAALFLDRFCNTPAHPIVEVSIYEKAHEYKEIGAGLGLGPNVTKLYARLRSEVDGIPILDAINATSGSRNDTWFTFRRSDSGHEIITVPQSEREDARVRFVGVSRAELHAILLEHVQKKQEIIGGRLFTGKKLVSISEDNGNSETVSQFPSSVDKDGKKLKPVKIAFQDGTTTVADLVIAADGIRSAVRRQFIADEPIYGNKILYRGLIPMSSLPTPWPMPSHAVMWNAIGSHFVMYPISANKTINIVACKDKPLSELGDDLANESWVATCDRSELEHDFAEYGDPIMRKVIRQMPQQVSKWRINDRQPLDKWVFMEGRVVLLGDAAHPMVPHQSAGAGQAVEDAYILAKALGQFLLLGDEKGIAERDRWMILYQNIRMPRAARAQATSREAGDLFELMGPQMEGKSYDERLSILKDGAMENMKWIWTEDIDAAWDEGLTGMD